MALQKIKNALGFGTEQKALTLTDPDALSLFGVLPTTSGVSIGPSTAMRVPAVACAVGLISETIGALPFKLYGRADKSAWIDHPAYRLVHEEANPWTTAAELREQLTLDALLHGEGYAQVVRLADDTPYELHRLKPGKVQRFEENDGEPYYMVSTDTGQVRLSYRDVLRVEAIGGVSPITLGREAIALALTFEQHISSSLKNGTRLSGVIEHPNKLDATAKLNLLKDWKATHSGQNTGNPAIADEGAKFVPMAMTLADAEFAENRLEQIREIARVFRVPPTMLFELSRGTWSNTEEMARQFLQITLKPWLTDWAGAYARCLLTPEERANAYFEAVTDDLLTTDTVARATAYGQYRSMGAVTANEVRAGLNLPPLPGGDTLDNPHITTPDNRTKDKAA
ncbi:phage portal protein [Thalassovita sp.]|uniref:phage portal protein n=1 Tax=Thalassovita sp. TaxID=1979401 RepID=UPI002B2738EE|nr:phage portal protein [Thalassovita sp.]